MNLIELRNITKEYLGKEDIDLLDMTIVLLEEESNAEISKIFKNANASKEKLGYLIRKYKSQGNSMPQALIMKAIYSKRGDSFCDVDLIKFILADSNDFTKFLESNHYDCKAIIKTIEEQPKTDIIKSSLNADFIDNCLTNMTEIAKSGRFDYLVGRGAECDIIKNILLRKEKANVILTGAAGVGKTAVVELLVKQSFRESCNRLSNYTFYSIDITQLLSGSAYRGQLEGKLASILRKCVKNKNTVIFIDEIHRINQSIDNIGEGSLIAEILKPYLTRDDIRIIGATTTREYQKYIARYPALDRRFQQVVIPELGGAYLFDVVKSYAESLSKYHKIEIEEDTIKTAILLADEYVENKSQPDKTNELIDSACVMAANEGKNILARSHIVKMLSATTMIPEYIINKNVGTSMTAINKIKNRIFGQDKQIEQVVRTTTVKMSGFKENDAPLASFIFAGDSGVGKTCLAKLMAKEIIGNEKAITILDMSEFSERHSVSKLLGSPPGYVDSDKEGVLTNALSNTSFGIILFDEIEKAAPEVHKALLGVLDTGRLRSGLGIEYSANNMILIFTTNAAATHKIAKGSIGFVREVNEHSSLISDLEKTFPTEFLGRIDEIIMFNHLSDEDYKKIIKTQLLQIKEKFRKRNVHIIYDDEYIADYIIKKNDASQLGARNIINLIRNKITMPIIEAIADNYDELSEIDLTKLIKTKELD